MHEAFEKPNRSQEKKNANKLEANHTNEVG